MPKLLTYSTLTCLNLTVCSRSTTRFRKAPNDESENYSLVRPELHPRTRLLHRRHGGSSKSTETNTHVSGVDRPGRRSAPAEGSRDMMHAPNAKGHSPWNR